MRSGSPPRVRGKLELREILLGKAGITPAHAGKTSSPARKRAGRPDPPPRVRGKLFPSGSNFSAARDHPRVCGENRKESMRMHAYEGSPPRMRGKPPPPFKTVFGYGITPACAGKTDLPVMPATCIWDHPRVCGENRQFLAIYFSSWGSPPRVRGKHFHCVGSGR